MGSDAAHDTDSVLHGARLYDLLVWALTLGREGRFRRHLVQLARLGPGESVLDVGCGTGSLAIAAEDQAGPGGQVCGVDPSEEMLARARRKAVKAGARVRFETASVEALPFPDAAFDAVLSSLMLHHVSGEGRRQGIAEIARVLKPGGRFLAVDIGGTKGERRGFLHCLGRHGDFDLDELEPVLDGAGFQVLERGPVRTGVVGLSTLRFILAGTPSR